MKNLWPDDDGGLADVFDGEAILNKPVSDKYGLVCFEYDSSAGCIHGKEDWLYTIEIEGRDFLGLVDPEEVRRLQAELDRFAAAVARKHRRKPGEVFVPMLGCHWDDDFTDERRAEEAEMLSRLGMSIEEAKEVVRRFKDSD
jgi:hypothetical protein